MATIAYITPYFKPTSNAASIRASSFIDELIKKHDVTIFTALKNEKYNTISCYSKLPSNKDKNIIRLIKEFIFSFELFIRIICSKTREVYIITSPPFFIAIFAFFAVKIKRPEKIILDIRDIYPEVFFQHGIMRSDSLVGKLLMKVERFMYSNSNYVVTVTEGLKKSIEPYNSNVKIVRNGYDEELFRPNAEKYDDFTFVFHGTMGKFQNIELLSEVIKYCDENHKNLKFLVIGHGPKDYLIKNLRCKNFKYIENVQYKEIPNLISKAHLGLSFRTDDKISKESFPVKIFEYIGVGLPVVVTPISEAGNIVYENQFGIQNNNNIEEIIDSILFIKENYATLVSNIEKNRLSFTRKSHFEILDKLI
ncbi:glycosyltransferase family 4 protein [Flexistipes sp.]|uniref:glycosyltransferase family 4 protein n=1 Tax=Flexistipes sp. TaxID=3088135 RepID=UPI002E24C613|nr:glycosyltransferase family 4 protein [Flexistipes sp.]